MTLKHFNIENGRVFVIASYLLTNFHNSFRFFIIIQHSFQGSHPKVSTLKNCNELVLNYMMKYSTIKKNALFYQPYYSFWPNQICVIRYWYYHHWIEVKVA